jgi:2-amino-4-hydroxy-6-hydroxymethyldihydropteridine pyrophosphokinase
LTGIICYIGIGSNLGKPLQNCQDAIEKVSCVDGVQLIKVSSFYLTEPVDINADKYSIKNLAGVDDNDNKKTKANQSESKHQNWFINAVAEVKTNLSARDLLRKFSSDLTAMGRKRQIKGEPRVVDLDLLFYGQDIITEDNLNVPHPEIYKRRFVLEPLSEIASFYIHPAFGVSIRGLKDRLKDQRIVELYKGSDLSGRYLC